MDPVVQRVIERFQQRSEFGQKKYNTTLEGNTLPFLGWVQHMQEELMDAILYLEKMKSVQTTNSMIPQTHSDTQPETSDTSSSRNRGESCCLQ